MAVDSHIPNLTSRVERAVSGELKLHSSMGRALIAQDEDIANPRLVPEAEYVCPPVRGPGCVVLKEGRCSSQNSTTRWHVVVTGGP